MRLFPVEILVPPIEVARTFLDLCRDGDIGHNLLISLRRLALGYIGGALSGIAFGFGLALSPPMLSYCGMLFQMLRQIPVIALVPVFMVLFGIEEAFKISMVAVATFFPVALNTFDGARGVPVRLMDVASVLCFNRRTLLRRVIVPSSMPAIVTGLRLSLSRAWLILVAAELIASTDGIGYLIDWGRQLFQIDVVFVGVLLAGSIGFAFDALLRLAERRTLAWRS